MFVEFFSVIQPTSTPFLQVIAGVTPAHACFCVWLQSLSVAKHATSRAHLCVTRCACTCKIVSLYHVLCVYMYACPCETHVRDRMHVLGASKPLLCLQVSFAALRGWRCVYARRRVYDCSVRNILFFVTLFYATPIGHLSTFFAPLWMRLNTYTLR